MKKTILSMIVIAFCIITLQSKAFSATAIKSTFATTSSSYTSTGLLISSATAKAVFHKIIVSWDVQTATSTFYLYGDVNQKGTLNEIFELKIPSGTYEPNFVIIDYNPAYPKVSEYGCWGVLDNTGHTVSCVIDYN